MWYSPRSPARDESRRWRGRVGRRVNTAEVERWHAVGGIRRRDGLHGRERRIVEAAADPRSVEPRRLDAREDDIEALREHAAQQFAAVRPPERQERRDAGLFPALLDPVPSHRADEVDVARRDDRDALFVAQASHPSNVRGLVVRAVDDDVAQRQA